MNSMHLTDSQQKRLIEAQRVLRSIVAGKGGGDWQSIIDEINSIDGACAELRDTDFNDIDVNIFDFYCQLYNPDVEWTANDEWAIGSEWAVYDDAVEPSERYLNSGNFSWDGESATDKIEVY